jgi:hypothetical protein
MRKIAAKVFMSLAVACATIAPALAAQPVVFLSTGGADAKAEWLGHHPSRGLEGRKSIR